MVDAGGEFSRERGGSESMREPKGVPERLSSDGVGEQTDILSRGPHTPWREGKKTANKYIIRHKEGQP